MVSKLEIYVYRDKLTGLSNTTAYSRKFKEIEEMDEDELKYAVIVFDVNFLKRVNDTYGHEAGNELIRSAASIISKTFEESTVFILENNDYEQRDDLLAIFDKAVADKHFNVQDTKIHISVARGLSVWRKGMNYAEVFQEADEAMYAHKSAIKKEMGINHKEER